MKMEYKLAKNSCTKCQTTGKKYFYFLQKG
jgi:hypothetical protein